MHIRFNQHRRNNPNSSDSATPSSFSRVQLYAARWAIALSTTSLALVLAVSPAHAQEDPFGGGADVFGENDNADVVDNTAAAPQDPAGATALPPLASDANVVAKMLREDPPNGLVELGRAVQLMYRLQEYGELGRYMDQLAPLVSSAQAAEALTQQQGSELWLRLSLQPELSDAQRQLATKILQLVSETRSAPQTIQQALEGLKSSSPVTRKRSAIQVQQAGSKGLQALVMAVAENTIPANSIVVDLIDSYDRSGVDALSAALDTADQAQRERLLYASIAFVGKGLLPQLSIALHDENCSDTVKHSIAEVFTRRSRELPTVAQARQFLLQEIAHDLNLARSMPVDSDTEALVSIWLWNEKTKAIELATGYSNTYYLQKASEKSIALLRSQTTIDEGSVLAAAAVLQRDYAVEQYLRNDVLNLRTQNPLEGRSDLIGERGQDLGFWVSVYKTAAVNQLYAAQLRSIQQIGALQTLSHLHNDIAQTLLDGIKSGVPAVRYASLEIVLRSESLQLVPQIAQQLESARRRQTQFVGYPTALIVGASPELRQAAINQLNTLGIEAIEASTGREAVQQIQRFAPLEYIFVVDRVRDMPVSEAVQRLAAYAPTSAIPIGILTQNLTQGEAIVLQETPRLVYGTLTELDNYMESVVRRMNSLADIPLPSRSDRLVWTGMLNASEAD